MGENMKDVRNDAARLSLLHDIGIVSSEDVVRWADGLIVSEEKPSQELIELSTSFAKGVGDALRSLAVGADVWPPVEEALSEILEFVTAQPDRAPIVARAFYHIAVTQKYQVPDVLRFILSAEDDFDLAASGVYLLADVHPRFVENIKAAIAAKKRPIQIITDNSGASPLRV
jgi:hypothetical protein